MVAERVQKMDMNKNRLSASSKINGKRAVNFVGEVKQELKKVEWTNKSEIKNYTKIVLLSTLFFAMFVYLIDLIMQGLLGFFNLVIKFFI